MSTKMMKKLKVMTAAALILGVGSNLLAPREAKAIFVSGNFMLLPGIGLAIGMMEANSEPVGWAGLAALVGVVIADQRLTTLPPVTQQDLLDNGYSGAQAELIFADMNKLNEKLKAEKKVLTLGDHETQTSIRDGLKMISPDASQEFLDVYSQRLFLVAQSKQNAKDARVTDSAVKPNSEIPASSSSSAETGSEAAAAK